MENKPEKIQQVSKPELWAKLIDFGFEFAVYIALPLLAVIYLGKWLDAKYNTKLFIPLGIPVALFVSGMLIYRKIKELKDMMK